MSADALMLQAADALEKMAAYVENNETSRIEKETAVRMKQANALADQISDMVGEPVDEEVVSKLAEATPEVQELLSRLTGGDNVDSLGGPQEVSKVASVDGNHQPADARFLDWVNS